MVVKCMSEAGQGELGADQSEWGRVRVSRGAGQRCHFLYSKHVPDKRVFRVRSGGAVCVLEGGHSSGFEGVRGGDDDAVTAD